jgi:hypothetical protein
MNAPVTDIAALKDSGHALQVQPQHDYAIDMFTERGFGLAQRIAKAYASSDAVPAQFRTHNLKKVGKEEHWVENPAALGNCLVAIEVARAVGMSITAVMQNADMIEGKLRWSGKFVIAAINASGRFTPLRFQMVNRGRLKAKYKEKTGWDNEARRPIFVDREVDVDDIVCVAWALPKGLPEPKLTPELLKEYPGRMLDLYKALGWPVIESAPVSMKMVVEEGWYAKSGSKWQTEMRELMFQYRAGSFFGNIHAPDIVMGMGGGQTSEEARDIMPATFDLGADGTVTPTPVSELRAATKGPVQPADVVEPTKTPAPAGAAAPTASPAAGAKTDQATGEIFGDEPAGTSSAAATRTTAFDPDAFAEKLEACRDLKTLRVLGDSIRDIVNDDHRSTMEDIFMRRQEELEKAAPQASSAPAQPASRRRAAPPPTEG